MEDGNCLICFENKIRHINSIDIKNSCTHINICINCFKRNIVLCFCNIQKNENKAGILCYFCPFCRVRVTYSSIELYDIINKLYNTDTIYINIHSTCKTPSMNVIRQITFKNCGCRSQEDLDCSINDCDDDFETFINKYFQVNL